MVCYKDDIYIGETNQNEKKQTKKTKTDIVLNRLKNAGMRINEKNA